MLSFNFKAFLLVAAIAAGDAVRGAPAAIKGVTVGNHNVTAAAAPVKLAGPGVYVTTELFWAGPHLYIPSVVKTQCYTFAAEWQNVISSFGPDSGLQCYGYQQSDCQPPHPNYGPFFTPGIATHDAWDQDGFNWENRVNSFICYEGTPPISSSEITTRTPSTSATRRSTVIVGPTSRSSPGTTVFPTSTAPTAPPITTILFPTIFGTHV